MFGNTETIARAIAEELREKFDVNVANVNTMPRAFDMDLIVIGGPTHNFGMSRPSTRAGSSAEAVRPHAVDIGIREYLPCSPLLPEMPAAAFGTKADKPFLIGSAAHRAQHQLHRLGCRIVLPAENFLVRGIAGRSKQSRKAARQRVATLAAIVAAAQHTV